MKIPLSIFLLVFVAAQQLPQVTAQKKLVCYYGSWSSYRPSFGQFRVEDIDPNICTHIIYAFIGLNTDGTINVIDPLNDLTVNNGRGGFEKFNKLKQLNPNLKTMVAVGGWNEGSTVFSEIAMTATVRARFVNNAFNFVRQYGFNGLDVDWEFPAQRGGSPADKNNFVLLLQELKAKFAPADLLVSIAVSASIYATANSYDVPRLANTVDFVNLMTYDFHGFWEYATGHNSPLYPTSVDSDKTINSDATVRQWLRAGAPADKLVLGVPTYGRTYTLQNANSPGMGAAAVGPGYSGRYTQEASFLGYNEICEMQMAGGWSVNWAAQAKVPFAFQGTLWAAYENPESVRIKSEYVKMLNLGGAMVWTVDTDDFRGRCGAGRYPLINSIKKALAAPGVSPDANAPTTVASRPSTVNWFTDPTTTTRVTTTAGTTTTTRATTTVGTTTTTRAPTTTGTTTTTRAPTTTGTTTTTRAPTTAETTTTTNPSSGFKCTAAGYFRDPSNCNKFYNCQVGGTGFIRYDFACPSGLYFSTNIQQCDWPANVKCP